MHRESESERCGAMTVSELARNICVPSEWIVGLCVAANVPGVTGGGSVLSPKQCQQIRDAYRKAQVKRNGTNGSHGPVNRMMPMPQPPAPGSVRRPTAGPGGRGEPQGRAGAHDIAAKARNLISDGHYDFAIIILYAPIDNAMRRRLTPEQLVGNRPIEDNFGPPNESVLSRDLHHVRILANQAKHEGLVPTRYEAEKALWLYQWLFGPQGEFGRSNGKPSC